jgi:hypothetical protein
LAESAHKPLAIALLGMNKRDAARLEMFLDHYWSSRCILVNERFADLCIIDLDSVEGKNTLPRILEQQPGRPVVAMSVRDTEINEVALLRKPLGVGTLNQVIEGHVKALAEKMKTQEKNAAAQKPQQQAVSTPHIIAKSTPKTPPVPRQERPDPLPSSPAINLRRRALPSLSAQARIIRGSSNLIENTEPNIASLGDNMYYKPSTHLQQILKTCIDQCRQDGLAVKLSLPDGKYIALIPDPEMAVTNLSDNMLRSRCLLPISQLQIRTIRLGPTEIRQMQNNIDIAQDIDFLLWKVSLWSARGRLPLGTHGDSVITLKQWPNLTRLLAIPEFLRIAALWAKTPVSVHKTIETLNIEARYVYAFYSACFALELAYAAPANDEHVETMNKSDKPGAPKGILRRILQRLRVA